MTLEFVDRRRGDADKYSWLPFELSDEFNEDWWDRTPYFADDPWYVQVLQDGDEVARIEFDEHVGSLHHYGVDRDSLEDVLEIQFFEVASSRRNAGLGTEIVRRIETLFPDRTLIAFSEDADDFWESLGWQRNAHPTEPQFHRTLFILRR